MDYPMLINLIKCFGIGSILSIIVIVIALVHAPEFPEDDGERM